MKLPILLIMLCAVIIIDCTPCSRTQEYTRVKRAKFYTPQRYYRRPPMTYPVKGTYSYTPPPMHMIEEEDYPGFPKVKRPTDTLGDDDINNFVKYLSKQDLDKIIQAANIKGNKEPFESKLSAYREDMFKINDQQFSNGPTQKTYEDFRNPIYVNDMTPRIVNKDPINNALGNTLLNTEESAQNSQILFLNSQIQEKQNERDAYTEDKQEEMLPRPVNLRDEQDYDGSASYKVESFGDLPLMSYKKKEQAISSYEVPHYTVTTFSKPSQNSKTNPPSNAPPLEPAPPASAAKEQSDAHLKAIKIWTHKSRGTAYYLHSDGTLSLEKPQRPRSYGHP